MTVEPGALRAIADELEAAQRRAETEAIDRLTALVNGAADHAFSMHPGADGRPEPEDPQGTGENAGSIPVASITPPAGRGPLAPPGSNPFATRKVQGKRPCPFCGREFKVAGLGIHEAAHRRRGEHLPDPISLPEPLRSTAAHSYLCRYCNRPFKNQLDLEVHEASHPAPPKGKPVGDPQGVGFPGGRPD